MLHHGADYTPYEGLDIRGWPVRLLLRGKNIVQDGHFAAPSPHGSYLPRERSSLTKQRSEALS
jgi:dihydropyrimidinase